LVQFPACQTSPQRSANSNRNAAVSSLGSTASTGQSPRSTEQAIDGAVEEQCPPPLGLVSPQHSGLGGPNSGTRRSSLSTGAEGANCLPRPFPTSGQRRRPVGQS